jgi:hypothetical protein
MRKIILLFSILFLWTCGGGDKTTGPEEPPIVINLTSLTGQAQKGPFNNGTSINVAELTNTLSPTGRNFSSAITDNTGRFSVANVQLESPYVELRANGFYFNEVSNELSEAQLTLYALSNLTGKTSLNVNIITHLEKNRMITLMSGDNPQTFAQAKNNAQEAIFAIFDYSRANVPDSELLDISQGGAANAKLLAISAILQGDLTVAQMSELLANISTDIATDGTLDDASLRATLINNSKNLDMAQIRGNLVARYASLGISATIADFETEINQFLKPPVVQDIGLSVDEDTTINITLTGSDPEGESITYSLVDDSNNATVTLNGNVASYTPDTHFNGTDTFTYKANDGTSDSNLGTVTITVNAVDDDPNTNDIAVTTDEDNAIDISLTADEYDGDSYSFAIITDVSNGTSSLNGTVVTYTPNQDWNGTDTFTFEATDDTGRTMNVATATITVNPINDAPVANDITNQTTDENRMMQLDITLDATDVDGDALTYGVAGTNNGSVTINDNIATYVPNQDWNGTDTFTYNANDSTVDSNTATITITVNSVNDAPVIIPAANNGTTIMSEDGSMYEQFTATDVDGDDVTLSIVTNPVYATITNFTNNDPDCPGNCASFTYTPNTNWNGTDTFTYKANDGTVDSDIATHTFIVNAVNEGAIANTVSSSTDEDVQTDYINLRLFDPDNGMGDVDPKLVDLPEGWEGGFNWYNFSVEGATISSSQNFININIDDPFNNYDLIIGLQFDGSNWIHYPLTTDSQWDQFDPFSTLESLILNISDHLNVYPWVDTLEEALDFFTNDSGGIWGGHGYSDYNIWFRPKLNYNGTQIISYYGKTSCCGDGNVSTITLTVNPVDDAPVANNITSSVDEDMTGHTVTIVGDSEGGSDVDGDTLTFSIVTPPSNGSIYNESGGGIPDGDALVAGDALTSSFTIYNPNANYNGTDTFTFKANDGALDSNVGTVTMNVNPTNDPPTAQNVGVVTRENVPVALTLSGSDIDPGTSLTYIVSSQPSNGTLITSDNINFIYTPNTGYIGLDGASYVANDGETNSNTANILISVIAGSAPIAGNGTYALSYDSSTTYEIELSGNASDPDLDPMTYVIDSQPSIGSVTLDGSLVTYTIDESEIGNSYSTSFTWYANDGANNSNIATLTIEADLILGGYIVDISEYDHDAYTSNFSSGLRTAQVSYLGERNTGSTDFFIGNREGNVNVKAFARDFDRFDYWQGDYSLEINFNETSLAYDYIYEWVNGFVPFAMYLHDNATGERTQIFAAFWDINADGQWNYTTEHIEPVYGYNVYEPIYAFVPTDISNPYDPTNIGTYSADNDLTTSGGCGWGSEGSCNFVTPSGIQVGYPFVTALFIADANNSLDIIFKPPTATNHSVSGTGYTTGSAIFFKTERSSSRSAQQEPFQIPMRYNQGWIEK